MCAAAQGKFWEMHDALFSSQTRWAPLPKPGPTFDSLATQMGLAMPTWRQCVAKHSTAALIESDRDRSASAGVQSTPSFFVGDQPLAGADAPLRQALDAALAKTRPSRVKPPAR